MQNESSRPGSTWRRRLALFLVAATAATSVAVVSSVGGASMATAAEPPAPLPEGWQGTVSVVHTSATGTTTMTATFDPTGFRRSRSWAEAFPWGGFEDQAATSRMWQQDYSVTYSFSGSTPRYSSGDENVSICVPSTTTTATAPTHYETMHVDVWGGASDYDQISIGDRGEALDPRQLLMIDLRGIVPDVTQTRVVNGDCSGIAPSTTVQTESRGYRFDLLHGFAGGYATQDVADDVDAQWPMEPGTDGRIRLQGSKTFHGIILGSDPLETDSSTITWDLTLVPGEPDTDGDGVADDEDQCPLVAGTVANQGCPGPSSDCTGEAANRGYAVAEYAAEIDTLLGDPDLFRFDVSANWCEVDGLLEVDTVTHQGYVELGATLGTALELLGFTFRYDPARSSSIGSESGSVGEVTGIGQFDSCFDWLALAGSGAGGRVIKGAVSKIAKSVARHLPKTTKRLGSVNQIVEDALEGIDRRIIAMADDLERRVRDKLDDLLPDGLARDLAAGMADKIVSVGELFRARMAQGLHSAISAALLLPESGQRKALRDLRASVGDLVAETLAGLFDTTQCFEVWQPEVTLTVPAFGASSSSIAGFVNPFLVVSGGITTDTR